MAHASPVQAERKPEARSAITNGRLLPRGIDGRSTEARRFRDLVDALAAPFGGLQAAPEIIRQTIRRSAALALQAEGLEEAMARGEAVDPIAFATVTNVLQRCLKRLEVARPKPKAGAALDAHLAMLAQITAAADEGGNSEIAEGSDT